MGAFLIHVRIYYMDRNYLIDLILSIAQDAAEEWHIKEELSGLETEKDAIDKETMPDLFKDIEKRIEETKNKYYNTACLRREKTDVLAKLSPAYDYHKRCQLKHRATSFVQCTEAYLAKKDEILYDVMKKSEDAFWEAVKEFMGIDDIPNCGRCLSDELNRNLGE